MSLVKPIHRSLFVAVFTGVIFMTCTQEIRTTISPLTYFPNPQNGYGSGGDQLAQPDDVEILSDGRLIISDVDNNRIQQFDRSGALTKTIDAQSLGLSITEMTPTGIASDGKGFVYITLEGVGSVARFNPDMTLDQLIGYQGVVNAEDYYLDENDGLLIKPQGIIVSDRGDIYVADMDKTIFRKDGVYNFGFRKFKQITVDGETKYEYDKEFAATQEVTRVMRKSEGMAISEARGLLFVAEEKPEADQFGNIDKYRYIGVFDLKTGRFRDRLIGVEMAGGKIISGYSHDSIEGLSVFEDFLFAVDEKAGRVDCYNIDSGARIAHFGTRAPFYCDDESDCVIDGVNYNEQSIMAGSAQVHLLNDWKKNELASPDGVCAVELDNGEKRLAVVDQWNSRVILYELDQIISGRQ